MAGRKSLPHDPPFWVDSASEVWFITVCGQPRGQNQFARPELWTFLTESLQRRVESDAWWVHLFVALPDHCHLLASFPPDRAMKKVITDWKRWVARQRGIRWQIDFFDHRLRADESFAEKARYIVENPVRAGLVERVEGWPYVWRPAEAAPFTGLHR